MHRKDGESYIEYIRRVTDSKDCGSISFKEWGDYLLGHDNNYSEDNLRKSYYVIKKILPKIEIDSATLTTDDIVESIEEERRELYKDKVKLRDQRRELNKVLMNAARFENLIEVMQDEIRNMDDLSQPYNEQKIDNSVHVKEASMLISDMHLGIEFDSPVNYYSIDTAIDRLNQYKCKVINYCRENNVTKLNVEILGDMISGIIHGSVRVQQEEDAITQLMIVSEALANAINDMKNYIPQIVVYNVFGNHSRLISAKKESITSENMERLISFYLKARLNNIKVIDGYTQDYLWYKIGDRRIVLTHGDKDSTKSALNNMVRVLGFVPDEIHIGHQHYHETIDDCDTEIVANGSLVGADTYAVDIRKVTKPSQILRIYEPNGDTQNIKIYLE